MHLEMLPAKWRPIFLGLNERTEFSVTPNKDMSISYLLYASLSGRQTLKTFGIFYL